MNTNTLKKFAQEARKKLINQVGAKMDFVLANTQISALLERRDQVKALNEAISLSSKAQVIDKVAYTWFNRLMALRFMDVNDFQPLGLRVISPKDGFTTPELLEEVKRGHIPADLPVKKDRIYDLLDGKIPSPNSQNEVFKELLIGACNHLHKTLPFLFEWINDYTDLLLPDDLTSEFSVVQDIRNGMSADDCEEVEIIGWLYQFYISEKKDEVFASKTKVKKEDIPAATQLFTPRWIVEYMVQNTVGKVWLQNRPNSMLKEHMPYYIGSASVQDGDYLKINSVEDIKLLDQACGSGHILVYGFDLFYKIYEEEGYNPHEIPKLILEKNLYGFEIDERAAQLASMALMMKARSYSKRLFRELVTPNILCYEDLKLSKAEIEETLRLIGVKASDALLNDLKVMGQATNLGSLIYPQASLAELQTVNTKLQEKASFTDAFLSYQIQQLQAAVHQLIQLGGKYHCVVDNPPYMGGGAMNKELTAFVKLNYPNSKADLMTCFMEAGIKVLLQNGFLGMINQQTWMFLSSYESFRESLLSNFYIDSLIQIGYNSFPELNSKVVQASTFVIQNSKPNGEGSYFNLNDAPQSADKKAIFDLKLNSKEFYISNQLSFKKIPGRPIGYWVSEKVMTCFNDEKVGDLFEVLTGMTTGNNLKHIKLWHEVSLGNSNLEFIENKDSELWVPYSKGGEFRRWYGNYDYVVDWKNRLEFNRAKTTLKRLYFKEGITWSFLTSGKFNARVLPGGFLWDVAGSPVFAKNSKSLDYLLGLVNSVVGQKIINIYNPTLNFQAIDVSNIPIKISNEFRITNLVLEMKSISSLDWNSRETSWDLKTNNFLKQRSLDLEDTFDLFSQYWKNKFFQLHRNEEELNRQFIEIYGLQEELTPSVPLEEITILQGELDRESLKAQNARLERDQVTGLVIDYSGIELKFDAKEVFAQFISYVVGCMFGRYSLDKEGLILANQGETLEDYLRIVRSSARLPDGQGVETSFFPDDDNIIPVLDDEWFEDDIVARFKEFLKVTFGTQNLDKNLAFVESALGKDIRKYFVKDFYTDHIQRYKKRPIYWMFSSPQGSFNVLIYLHRYTPDTLSKILNDYLNQYREKLKARSEHLDQVIISGSSTEQTKAAKEKDKIRGVLLELQEYERDILYPIATERISIDLDDGVLVNYNKFGQAIKEVKGLNDKKTKEKVRGFDWIDASMIR